MEYTEELENLKLEGIEEEDIEEARINKPEEPNFPMLVFMVALFKDISDVPGSLLTFGLWSPIINWVVVVPTMFFYMRGKIGFVKKKIYRKYVFTAITETIPFISWLPQNSIFVLRAHAEEKGQIGRVLNFIESFAKI